MREFGELLGEYTEDWPTGGCNADCGTIMEILDGSVDFLYLVGESKARQHIDNLCRYERRKIPFCRRHVSDTLELDPPTYGIVAEASQLRDGAV